MKYFKSSIITTILGIIAAWFWGEHILKGSGLTCIFIALILSVLEVSLSFDNAVINATKLEKMSPVWRHRFITWGILIAVFGMRLLFPIAVVSIFAKLSCLSVLNMALNDAGQYAHYLELTHAPIVMFGGTFLMMLFLSYFFNKDKDTHWIGCIEKPLTKCSNINGFEIITTLVFLLITSRFVIFSQQKEVLIAGICGIITYLLIDGISHALENQEEQRAKTLSSTVKGAGLISFLYLELIDASFSLDGVLGAFALSSDIIIITIGLSIGAVFVRSLTIMLTENKTLAQYRYLENGAHWAIGALSIIMMISTFKEIPEIITGLIGLTFIIMSFISSILHNKKKAS
ncbi:DUF475 domain-containing protein [bacterium]|nr:DUF475 domain-containing protein [bacterium]